MAKVSVIIPLYNKGRYISRALDSVFAQMYQDYELIVVDDGSTDGGAEIVKQYRDRRLRLVRQRNSGPGAARNRGVSESKTPLLAFLDADDEWMPEFLRKSVDMLQINPDCDLTASTYFVGEEKFDVTVRFAKGGVTGGPWQLYEEMPLRELKAGHYIFNSWAILCKRKLIEKYGGFRTKDRCSYGEDTYLWLQVMFNHKVYRILEPLVWYHSEVSQLGPALGKKQPLQTFLTEPDPIRISCPPEHRELLEQFLAGFALAKAHECAAGNGNASYLDYLLDEFPLMKKYRWEYAKLRLKMILPELIPAIRYLKRTCSNTRYFHININNNNPGKSE